MATAASAEKPEGEKVVKGDEKTPELKEVQDEKKEATTEEEKKKPPDLAILKFVMKYVKFVGAALVIWFMGWMGFSYVWVAIALFLGVLWKMNKEDKQKKMAGFKEVTENEQEAIIARMEDLPSWVFFPDVERAEWLNKMLKQLWPYINDMVIKILKETVEPEIQKQMPSFLKSIRFDEITLGYQPPRIGGIKTYTQNVKRSEIIMDIDLIYAGDADIKLEVKGVGVGIEDVQLRGTLRVIMSPLIPAAPLVGGLQVFFLNRPDVDFDLTNLLNILDIPGLSDIIRGVIDDVIAHFVVLPNRIAIPLTDVDPYKLKYPLPDGMLRLQVLEAKDLMKKDIGVFSKGSSDPYAIIKVGAKTFKTKTKKETLNPVWNEVFEVFVDTQQGQKIKIKLFDEDKASDDESLGSVEADISTIVQQGTADLWLPLENVEHGQINLRCTWFTLSANPEDLSPPEKAVQGDEMLATAGLFVKLDSAKNLPITNPARGTCSAYAKLTVGNVTYQSQTIADSISPVFEEPFRFMIHDPNIQELDIELFDSGKDKSLGKLDFALARLTKDEDMTFEQPFPLKQSGHNSTLTCRFTLKALVTRDDDTSDEEDQEEEPAVELVAGGKTDEKGSEETTVRRRKPEKSKIKRTVSGDIQMTIAYKTQGSKLSVTVHKCRDLIACDSDGLADPYVRAYLLPDKSRSSRRRSDIQKNTLAPVFEEVFDWQVPEDKLKERTLDITVKNDVSFFSKSKTSMGQVLIDVGKLDLSQPVTNWYPLLDEKEED